MTISELATTVSGTIAAGGIFTAVISRAFKHWLGEQLKELRPNGGGSTYDIIRRTAQNVDDLHAKNEELLERVSKLEQVVVAWTPVKKTAPKATKITTTAKKATSGKTKS